MKIEKNVLISIEATDIKDGVLKLPKSVKKIADRVITYNGSITKVVAPVLTTIGNYNFRYGKDVKKAISDLQFKVVAEKLKKEPIKADTMISVNYYRLITGACEFGCQEFIRQNNLDKEEYRADELLHILVKNNAYGVESFKRLVDFEY